MKTIAFSFFLFSFIPGVPAASRPECFPTGPACLRPQVGECRDALLKMRYTDPGYVTTFGRHLVWKRNTIDVPRVWHSFPKNCEVKLDAVTDSATDEFRLQALTTQGEAIISACITGGTHCGGIINVGPKRVMQLMIGHYSAIKLVSLDGEHPTNVSLSRPPAAFALNNSLEINSDRETS